jgi:hypothetical protein
MMEWKSAGAATMLFHDTKVFYTGHVYARRRGYESDSEVEEGMKWWWTYHLYGDPIQI